MEVMGGRLLPGTWVCVCLGPQAVWMVYSGGQAVGIGVLNRAPWEIGFVNIGVKGAPGGSSGLGCVWGGEGGLR